MEKLALIGFQGQLGSDIHTLLQPTYEILPLNHDTFAIENETLVHEILSNFKPNIVINTAAFHNVGLCEIQPQKAFLINAIALKYLSEACNNINATLVHFSSDYVFGLDEKRKIPYEESDNPNPIQIYGVSKLAGEKILQKYCKKYLCLRTTGLYGIRGTKAKKYPNFVEMMIEFGKKAQEKGEKLPSAQDQVLTFTPTIEMAKVVAKLIKKDVFGIYHATCEGYASRYEFVQEIFNLLNIQVELYGEDSDYFQPTFAQPKFSALENTKLKKLGITMPHWKEALKKYLQIRKKYL